MLKWLKRFLLFFLVLVLCLVAIAVFKTYSNNSKQVTITHKIERSELPSDSVIINLSKAIQFRTITPVNQADRDSVVFLKFHKFLEQTFPLVHQNLKKENINGLSLLYTWKGKSEVKKPFLLMAHQDVVPADDAAAWKRPPFSGAISEGFVYGRGSLDIKKSGLLGILESVEVLLQASYVPEQTIYLAFGHDEESGRGEGALAIAETLAERNVHLDFVLDEGGLILREALPRLKKPVALIGIAEKGFVNLKMIAKGHGGHSSMPYGETAVTRLARAIEQVNKNPFPASLEGPVGNMLDYVAPEMSFPMNLVFSNRWLFSGVIKSQMTKTASANAAIRTTSAVTMLAGSSKENVIPAEASATINVRLMPGMSPEKVVRHFLNIIDDSDVVFRLIEPYQSASSISDPESKSFKQLQKAIAIIYPEVITAPFLLVALTDSRHFSKVSDNIYRFHPAIYTKSDLERLHGKNERISIDDYKRAIVFYTTVIKNQKF